jgi:hypothetical protein
MHEMPNSLMLIVDFVTCYVLFRLVLRFWPSQINIYVGASAALIVLSLFGALRNGIGLTEILSISFRLTESEFSGGAFYFRNGLFTLPLWFFYLSSQKEKNS